MSYIISGPTTIGTTGALNNILGDLRLTDIGTDQGTIFFAGATGPGNFEALPPSTAGYILQTNGAGADPSWVLNSASISTNGFLAAKTAGDTFVNTEIQIQTWNTTTPVVGLSVNPFFNTGANFNVTTGVYTAPTTGTYIVDAYIEYSNTSPAHGSLKTLTFVETSSTPADGIIISCGPKQGSGNTLSYESLHIHQSVQLSAAATYALRIVASNSDTTNTILASSRYSIVFQSV
jgi:hypothetical protein